MWKYILGTEISETNTINVQEESKEPIEIEDEKILNLVNKVIEEKQLSEDNFSFFYGYKKILLL